MNLEELTIKDIGVQTAFKFIKVYDKKIKDAKEKFEEDKKRLEQNYIATIGRYNSTINEIRKLIEEEYTQCDECEGSGYITIYEHMHDDRGHSLHCKICNGIGYIEKNSHH